MPKTICGNYNSIWNNLSISKTRCFYIDDDGQVSLYDDAMPSEIRDRIYAQAEHKKTAAPELVPPAQPKQASDDFIPVGMVLTIGDRQFAIDSVNYISGSVSLRDNTFAAGTGFPIFRVESIEYVHSHVERQQWDSLEMDRTQNQADSDLVPVGTTVVESSRVPDGTSASIPPLQAGNYRIHDDHLGEGGQRTKADRNIEAIRALKGIEGEHRSATRDEQETLAQYVGWGGIPQIFDEANTDWQERREMLKALLTPDEYAAARASTLNAHYTSPIVIRAIYQGLENLGFRSGNILEPACGIGNFFGALPESMASSKLYGVELDSITGRIAQKLYPDAKISVQGFEHSVLPEGFFDAAVGNVPFGAYSLPDPQYDRHHFRIHDYFFAKALDKVRPGRTGAQGRANLQLQDPGQRISKANGSGAGRTGGCGAQGRR